MERISAAGEENKGQGVGVGEEENSVIVFGYGCPIRQCLTNSDGETNQVVKNVERAPEKRKSSSIKGINAKRAKTVETSDGEVITPEEIVKDDEDLAPLLEKMDTLPEKDKLVRENEFEAWSEPPILEKMVTTDEEMGVAKNSAEERQVQIKSPIRQVIKPISPPGTPIMTAQKLLKKKKAKGRNGNIYIGVANRIIWLELQKLFGFDTINNFGNFIMSYMSKVHEDFTILHQVAVDVGIFQAQGLTGFKWVNGLPHPVNSDDELIQLPEVELNDEYYKRAFEVTYDLCLNRGKFLVELASENQGAKGELDNEEELAVTSGTSSEDVTTNVEPKQALDMEAANVDSLPAATLEVVETDDVKKDEESEITPDMDPGDEDDKKESVSTNQDLESATNQEMETEVLEPGITLEIVTEEDKKGLETATTLETKVETKDEEVESKTLVGDSETMKTPIQPMKNCPLMYEMEEVGQDLVTIGPPIHLQLNMDSDYCLDDDKENIQPQGTTNTQARAVIAQVKKNTPRQILGEISLASIFSAENVNSFNTSNSMSKNSK